MIRPMCHHRKTIPSFPEYAACLCGNVYGPRKQTPLKLSKVGEKKYRYLAFAPYGLTPKRVHRHVYEAFVGKIPNKYHVHHKNGNKQDNRPKNLAAIPRSLNLLLRERKKGGSKYGRGISKRGPSFVVCVKHQNKLVHYASYSNLAEAKKKQKEIFQKLVGRYAEAAMI